MSLVELLLTPPPALGAYVLSVQRLQLLYFPTELVLCTLEKLQQKLLIHLDETHDYTV